MSDNHPPVTYWYVNATHLHMSHQNRWIRDASSLYITVAQAQTKLDMFCGLVADIFSRKLDPAMCQQLISLYRFVSNDAQLQKSRELD